MIERTLRCAESRRRTWGWEVCDARIAIGTLYTELMGSFVPVADCRGVKYPAEKQTVVTSNKVPEEDALNLRILAQGIKFSGNIIHHQLHLGQIAMTFMAY